MAGASSSDRTVPRNTVAAVQPVIALTRSVRLAKGFRKAQDHCVETCDVVVVGGGPAGLNAALVLGRCRRRVVVLDAGKPRNAAAPHSHGFLTRDGAPPLDIIAAGRREVAGYGVDLRELEVTHVACGGVGILVTLQDGATLATRKLLLATGVRDVLPDIPGVDALYGKSIHHCPYCDGWENRDRAVAVYGQPDAASGLALSLLTWTRDLVVCTDGQRLTASAKTRLAAAGIPARTERIVGLEGSNGRLSTIVFAKGQALRRHALFFNTGQGQRSQLAAQLGCRFTRTGHVRCDRKGRTGIPHLFIAGDANGDVQFVVVAAAEGAKAAVAINKELQAQDQEAAGLSR
jgi:thioredoxin reductase